jgi:peptidase C13-like protein/YcxB-like protein
METGASTPAGAPLRSAYEFQCTPDECAEALRFHNARLVRRSRQSRSVILSTIASTATVIALSTFAVTLIVPGQRANTRVFTLSLALMVAVGLASLVSLQRSLIRFAATELSSRRILALADDGLRCGTESGGVLVAWDAIRSVEETGSQILVYYDDLSFVQVPPSAFADGAERAAFLALLRSRRAAPNQSARATAPLVVDRPPTAAAKPQDFEGGWTNFVRSLREGLRLALFQQPVRDSRHAPVPSWSLLATLVCAAVLPALAIGPVRWGPKVSFSPNALPGVLFGVPILTLAAWALGRLAGRTEDTLRLLTAFLSLAIPIELAASIFGATVDERLATIAARWSEARLPDRMAALWLALATVVAAVRILRVPTRRWFPATLLGIAVVGVPLGVVYREDTLWYPAFDENPAAEFGRFAALRNEDVFYLQPRLLEQQLAALQHGRPGVVDLYFIGVAGYAPQDVFMKEVHSVAQLFEERFDTKGRSLMLINNPATVRETPIASPTSLRLALQRVGEVMDRDEDILFLFITSHGSKGHETSFDFSPMRFNPLDPRRLKEMLDGANIRRRVVVVSTCYSGAFVDVLKDERTLVISASAPDKNSFGCTNDAEFTFFGKAYFDEALRRTYSFTEAFDIAKAAIAERERNAHYPGSEPMMFAGDAIRAQLDRFVQRRLASAGRAAK